MNRAILVWAAGVIFRDMIEGNAVLEVGSRDVNGSLRPMLEAMNPKRYVGVDILPGPGVDVVANALDLHNHFAAWGWDVVVCTEVLEHVTEWRLLLDEINLVLRPGGLLILTTRSPGFPRHEYPEDYWRFVGGEIAVYLGWPVECYKSDPSEPGVFMLMRKPNPKAWEAPKA